MENITKPSITRLARKGGVKSLSDDCFEISRLFINKKLDDIIKLALVVNSEHQTKTLMPDDIYNAFEISGQRFTCSTELGTTTCNK